MNKLTDFQLDDPIRQAWEDVVKGGQSTTTHLVRPVILRSWLKSRQAGIDPFSNMGPPKLNEAQLNELFTENQVLMEICKPIMEMIAVSVGGTMFMVTLTSSSGHVLMVRGEGKIMQMAARNYYELGCQRDIPHAGTNAIGICIEEGLPIQLTGCEHYCVKHHNWTCSSAPIRDINGDLIGAITLSGPITGKHEHTLAVVKSAAESIDTRFRERTLLEKTHRLNALLSSILNCSSDGMITVDNKQKIININAKACHLLGLQMEQVEGHRLREFVEDDDMLLSAFQTGSRRNGIEANFNCPSGIKTFICRVDFIQDLDGQQEGGLITLSEHKQVISLTSRFGGNYAKCEFKDIKGSEGALAREVKMAKIAARTDSRILIYGESGTGKELFAQAIHNYSKRCDEPFVALSCATIPRDLVESELFGYRAGAFTGARREGMIGKFEMANRGTLFLDEINGLPLEIQVKLLRVLQQNEIVRLGDNRTIPVDVRIIAATNTDLMTEVENQDFREDLYYRLNVVELFIPPVRDRLADLPLLIDHILNRQASKVGIKRPRIADEVMAVFWEYPWPGNVRELENCIERAVVLCEGRTIRREHLPARMLNCGKRTPAGITTLQECCQDLIVQTLEQCGGNASKAAQVLNIGRSTLYRKMKEYDINPRAIQHRSTENVFRKPAVFPRNRSQ